MASFFLSNKHFLNVVFELQATKQMTFWQRLPANYTIMSSIRSVYCLLLVLFLTGQLEASNASGHEIDSLMRTRQWRQKSQIALLANDIMNMYDSDDKRFRAAFAWTAQNIRYDLAALNDNKLYSNHILVGSALQKRLALCEGYVAVLDSLSKLMGISTAKVPGYTRWNNKLQPEPHLWIAVRLHGDWFLSDPTWASGSIVNGRYVAAYDSNWFLVPPTKLINSHMPYDPIWQLLPQPLSHRGFIQNNKSHLEGLWQTSDSISNYLQSSVLNQHIGELRRLRQGFSHQALQPRIRFLEQSISVQRHNQVVEIMQQCNALFNAAVQEYNKAVDAFNQQKPRVQVLALLVRAGQVLESAKTMLPQSDVPQSLRNEMAMMLKQIHQLEELLRVAEKNWF
jgi:predicted metal-binding protein